jgi:FkbM family methyltransferase
MSGGMARNVGAAPDVAFAAHRLNPATIRLADGRWPSSAHASLMAKASGSATAPVTKAVLDPLSRRMQILERCSIDLLLDVGANEGQYAAWLRDAGWGGRVVSFEPLRAPFEALAEGARQDPDWECHRVALGARRGRTVMNVSADSVSSSILPLHDRTLALEPETTCVTTEQVRMARLDDWARATGLGNARFYLKIDVQGYELEVLRGGHSMLDQVIVAETEVSLVHSYIGQPLLADIASFLGDCGFGLVSLEPVSDDPASGQMLQLDAIFARHVGW